MAARVVYVAAPDAAVSWVVINVNTISGVAGFAEMPPTPPFVHEKVCTPAASCAVTVRVRILPSSLLVKAVTVPAVTLVHTGTLLSTNTASAEVVVIVIVSETPAAPADPVFSTAVVVKVNLMFVGLRPCTSSFDVAAEVNVA